MIYLSGARALFALRMTHQDAFSSKRGPNAPTNDVVLTRPIDKESPI
jgi:hypothetical protein